jgi:dUTP pyrophosphatase
MSYFSNTIGSLTSDSLTSDSLTTNFNAGPPSIKSQFLSAMSKKCSHFMVLKVFVNGSLALQDLYESSILAHNMKLIEQEYMDAGFDLFAPIEIKCPKGSVAKIDFHIQCASYMVDIGTHSLKEYPNGYLLFPRSSLSKTSLRLANSVGVIDAGYRGDVIGMFDCINNDYTIKQFDRLAQICSPGLAPIFVEMVPNDVALGATLRGSGGFGSSGR